MGAIIPAKNHPKSIWTWNRTKYGNKVTLYIPYLAKIEKQPKQEWLLSFNGGDVRVHPKNIELILLYGATASLPLQFLDDLRKYAVPLMIHRRNMATPSIFMPGSSCDIHDILTKQILFRENMKKRTYIARTLIRERFHSMEALMPIPDHQLRKLALFRSVKDVRILEAQINSRYWKTYFSNLGLEDISRRDKSHPINAALNACSIFLSGIILRWCLYHNLSVAHGYLHEQSGYPALVYDLIEPYRIYIDQAVTTAYKEHGDESLEEHSINNLKSMLDDKIYTHETRQMCSRSALLHGAVLALRAYLTGDMQRFVIPVEGEKIGGRPIKTSFLIPGGVKI